MCIYTSCTSKTFNYWYRQIFRKNVFVQSYKVILNTCNVTEARYNNNNKLYCPKCHHRTVAVNFARNLIINDYSERLFWHYSHKTKVSVLIYVLLDQNRASYSIVQVVIILSWLIPLLFIYLFISWSLLISSLSLYIPASLCEQWGCHSKSTSEFIDQHSGSPENNKSSIN